MFKELILSICIGIIFGIFLFIRTQHALKNAYTHEIRSKYALISHIASKYPPLNDDINTNPDNDSMTEEGKYKFNKPPNFTDPLFNPKSQETEKLRSEFSKLFAIMDRMRDFIIRDFIDDWYKPNISSDDTKFVNHIKYAIDGVFQILVKRISDTNWTYFVRDNIFHPLRECLSLYRHIVSDLSKNNPKWDELTETERDSFISEVISKQFKWHRGCDSNKSSIEYLRKWSLLLLEEVLDERNFHCFAVRFFCRELLTNNILYPIMDLVDGHNVNYAIVSGFIFLQAMNNEIITSDNESVKTESNNMISMQDLHNTNDSGIDLERDKSVSEMTESKESIIQTNMESKESIVNQTEISMQTMKFDRNMGKEEKTSVVRKRKRKRKRRASMDGSILTHYYKSFEISHFFIEMNGAQSQLLPLSPYKIRKGYSISCKYYIEAQHKFTLRFVSKECVNLCGRWVTLHGETEILGDLCSMKHFQRIEYCDHKYIYLWSDHKEHEYGSNYLQIGRQIIISNDIQTGNRNHKIRHVFVPLNIPLIHICFTAPQSTDNNPQKSVGNTSISEGLAKLGTAVIGAPLQVIDGIGEGIKKLLPKELLPKDGGKHVFTSPSNPLRTPEFQKKKGLFGKKREHSFHHDIADIGFLSSNKDKRKNRKDTEKDESKLRLLSTHRPTTNLTIRIWDVYRDFDIKMNPYVAYVLRIRDEITDTSHNHKIQRVEWTIKTRFSKLHSFHRAIQKDKILKNKNLKIVAQFPAKSLYTKMDASYIAERKKQLVSYFNTLHRYPDVLLSNAVYQLVIPPVLVDKYLSLSQSNNVSINTPSVSEERTQPNKKMKKQSKKLSKKTESDKHGFVHCSHPILPNVKHKDSSPDVSLPTVIGTDIAYFDDEFEEEKSDMFYMRPRRHSYPGCDAPNKLKIPPALNGDIPYKNPIPICIDFDEQKCIDISENIFEIDTENKSEMKSETPHIIHSPNMDRLERFRIESYEQLTPSLIKLIEAFLDLEKRSFYGSSLTIVATSILSWFFNGYIANKLYKHSTQLTMDGTLSFFMEWISDLLWIPPMYKMSDETPPVPTESETEKLRIEARECIQKMFEEYINDNVPKIIGQKKQLELCMIKFWRFMQQNKLLKHLAFSVIDALLQDLFPERVSRRYQRRVWIAERERKKDENKRRFEEKEAKRREKEKEKRLKQHLQSQKMSGKRAQISPKQKQKSDSKEQKSDTLKNKVLESVPQNGIISKSPAHKESMGLKNKKKNGKYNKHSHSTVILKKSQSMPMNRSKSRPLLSGDGPNIDFFSGGSLMSEYTKQFFKKKVESSEEDSSDSEESSSESESESEEVSIKEMRKSRSDGNGSVNRGFFQKLTGGNHRSKNGGKHNSKARKDNEVKPEYFMH